MRGNPSTNNELAVGFPRTLSWTVDLEDYEAAQGKMKTLE